MATLPTNKNAIMTYSGRKVSLASGVPSLVDLAVHMSKIVRFTGAVRGWWTVLDHSLLIQELAARDRHAPNVQLALLLHDAHEALFEDTPTHFKPEEMRTWQRRIDKRIFDEYYPGGASAYATGEIWELKHEYDHRSVLAEALLVGPPAFQTSGDVERHFGAKPLVRDVIHLLYALRHGDLGSNPADILKGEEQPTVQKFLARYGKLREQIDKEI